MALGLRWLGLLLACSAGWAQSVRVYSEFQRVDPSGAILAVDKAPHPREILSPAVVRGAYASYQAAVTVPEGVPFSVFVGQNPERTVDVTAYREIFVRRGEAVVPDGLEKLPISDMGWISDTAARTPGETTTVYWLDLWVHPNTPVGRFRFEVQMNVGEHWIVYPLEIRVLSPVARGVAAPDGAPADIEAPADASVRGPLLAFICGPGKESSEGPLTIRRLIRRNARQDMALARSLEPSLGLSAGILTVLGVGEEAQQWCQSPSFPKASGAEWYLRVRDYIYRTADRVSSPLARR